MAGHNYRCYDIGSQEGFAVRDNEIMTKLSLAMKCAYTGEEECLYGKATILVGKEGIISRRPMKSLFLRTVL